MSVDNTSSYSTNANKIDASRSVRSEATPDASVLREAFASAMRSSLGYGGAGSSVETTLFQALDSTKPEKLEQENKKDKTHQEQKNELSHNSQKKLSDRSELRQEQIQSDYQDQRDRRDRDQVQHEQKNHDTERTGQQQNNIPVPSEQLSWSGVVSTHVGPRISVRPPMVGSDFRAASAARVEVQGNQGASQSCMMGSTLVSGAAVTGNVPIANNISPQFGQTPTFSGTITSTPTAATVASVLTIFTAAGRMESEKREIEERNATEGRKKEKKKETRVYSFSAAVFENFRNTSSRESTPAAPRSSFVKADEQEAMVYREAFPEEEQGNKATDHKEKEDVLERVEYRKEELEEIAQAVVEQRAAEPTVSGQGGQSIVMDEPARESSATEHWDRIQLMQRIAAACQSAANQNGTIRVKLNLDLFGTVTIRMTHRENRLSVRFETTTALAADYLRENINSLRSTLEEHHVQLDQVEFEVVEAL